LKKAILIMVLSSLLLAGLGFVPTWKVAGSGGLWAMATGGSICLFCALISLIPLGYVLTKGMKDWWVQAALASMVLRMFSTLVLSLAAYWFLPLPLIVLTVWVVLYYGLLLICETAFVVRVVNKGDESSLTGESVLARGVVS
jgi:hypothetical protein